MPETYKGPTQAEGEKTTPQDGDTNRTSGQDQQQPLPNENLANQPLSSAKTQDPDNQQHQWNDQDPQKGVSSGVTEGHSSPQKPAHGKSAEATSKSSTGLPEKQDDGDHRPPSVKNSNQS